MIAFRQIANRVVRGRFHASSFTLAILPATLLCFFLVQTEKKRFIEATRGEETQNELIFADMNGDGISEAIQAGVGKSPFNYVVILDENMKYHEQWNVPGKLVRGISSLYTGDYDGDDKAEIYLFTLNNDSLFFNTYEPFQSDGLKYEHHFLTRIRLSRNTCTSTVNFCGLYDKDQDGKKELYFGITTGFGLEPRLLYALQLEDRRLHASAFTGVNISQPVMADIEGDGSPEIFGMITASGNYHVPTPYSDYSTWLMIYNSELQLKFSPREFKGFANTLYIKPMRYGDSVGYMAAHMVNSADTTVEKPKLMLYNARGMLKREKLISEITSTQFDEVALLSGTNEDYLVFIGEQLVVIDHAFNTVAKINTGLKGHLYSKPLDINADGINELGIYSATSQLLLIIDVGFRIIDHIPLSMPEYDWSISRKHSAGGVQTFIRSGTQTWFLAEKHNPFYWLSYLKYAAIYLMVALFVEVVKRISAKQIQARDSVRKRLLTLQLQGVKSQLDPHFTFNAINAVAAMIYTDDRDGAYDTLGKFTKLLRQMLKDADRIYRTLDEEITFVSMYLDLEKVRFRAKFDYRIDVDPNVDRRTPVPKLVLQLFAENAVKHAIMPLKSGGLLLIRISRTASELVMQIEDNGVGRANAPQSLTTGKGLGLVTEFYSILNELHRQSIRFSIEDLQGPQGQISGTKVEVVMKMVASDAITVNL